MQRLRLIIGYAEAVNIVNKSFKPGKARVLLLCEFLLHLLLEQEGINKLRNNVFIFFGKLCNAAELVNEGLIGQVFYSRVSGGAVLLKSQECCLKLELLSPFPNCQIKS